VAGIARKERRLGSSLIIIRMSAIRKPAAEAIACSRIGSGNQPGEERQIDRHPGREWLSARQAQALLNAPDITTTPGLRVRAILAVLPGCGLRRSEIAALTFAHVQQRDGR
jgi:integrase/recombinase XerD